MNGNKIKTPVPQRDERGCRGSTLL